MTTETANRSLQHEVSRVFSNMPTEWQPKQWLLYGALALTTHACLIVLGKNVEYEAPEQFMRTVNIEFTKPPVEVPKPQVLPPEPKPVKKVEQKPVTKPEPKPAVDNKPAAAPENRPLQSAETSTSSAELSLPAARPVPADVPLRDNVTETVTPARGSAGYLNNPAPSYPNIARNQGWEGRVLLKVKVLANGKPESIEIQSSSGRKALDEAALSAVKQWTFSPAKRGETAIEAWVTVPIEFKLG
ncbi:outer membrane transport energization protein TonB [Limnobacter thiooxidans]|uniref:Protein TonB n=1 Tax=Limnobacter thiooxidans TaxID=131080 RepID=A0AA86MEF9_9BURK|nr:outer membrane transport energization protein TonB [Limnobacter thiooxidans]BET26996.1 hypothetical protein RGQ30_24970 [Limnobacter thiooxidans]